MGNSPFIDGLPIKNGDFPMAMLNNQRVIAMQMGYDWGYTSDQANVEQNQRVEMSKDGG